MMADAEVRRLSVVSPDVEAVVWQWWHLHLGNTGSTENNRKKLVQMLSVIFPPPSPIGEKGME
jgi:hypothetical protein